MKNSRLEFEWDQKKAAGNLPKHGVLFKEAATVFSDVLSLTYDDSEHSHGEQRYVTIGLSVEGRQLVVAHTRRGERIRIVSARKATRRERRIYEKESN
jgi:uncharacterized protein